MKADLMVWERFDGKFRWRLLYPRKIVIYTYTLYTSEVNARRAAHRWAKQRNITIRNTTVNFHEEPEYPGAD